MTAKAWDSLGRTGFPIYLYNPDSLQMMHLEPEDPLKPAAQSPEVVDRSLDQKEDDGEAQVNNATSSKDPLGVAEPFQKIPLPSIADADEQHVLDPKILLECCRCSRSFNWRHGLPVGTGHVGVDHPRVLAYCSTIQEELKEFSGAAKAKDWEVSLGAD